MCNRRCLFHTFCELFLLADKHCSTVRLAYCKNVGGVDIVKTKYAQFLCKQLRKTQKCSIITLAFDRMRQTDSSIFIFFANFVENAVLSARTLPQIFREAKYSLRGVRQTYRLARLSAGRTDQSRIKKTFICGCGEIGRRA